MIVFFRIASESPNMRKIALMLEETGLPYVVKLVEPRKDGASDPEFAKVSPNGTAPAIVDTGTGTALFESAAILYFLAEKSGMLLPPALGARAEAMKWLMFEAANVCPTMLELHHYVMSDTGELPGAVFARYRGRLARYCSILERELRDREHLAGEYSIADIALYPWMAAMGDMAEIDLGDFPALGRWAGAIGSRAAAQRASLASSARTDWCYRDGGVVLCGA